MIKGLPLLYIPKSTFRIQWRAEGCSSLKKYTLFLHYEFQQVNAILGDLVSLLWEICWIHVQTLWTKCSVIFVTAVLLPRRIKFTSICYPNLNGQYNCTTFLMHSSIFLSICDTGDWYHHHFHYSRVYNYFLNLLINTIHIYLIAAIMHHFEHPLVRHV